MIEMTIDSQIDSLIFDVCCDRESCVSASMGCCKVLSMTAYSTQLHSGSCDFEHRGLSGGSLNTLAMRQYGRWAEDSQL